MEPDSTLLSEYEDAPKGEVRTIVDDDGGVVDFVQIYVPGKLARWWDEKPWVKELPQGTIPITRIPKKELEMSRRLTRGLLPKGPPPVGGEGMSALYSPIKIGNGKERPEPYFSTKGRPSWLGPSPTFTPRGPPLIIDHSDSILGDDYEI